MQLIFKHVARHFAERRVLEDISFAISGEKNLVVYGPNGSGKSTLLKIACSLLRPTSGAVIFQHNGNEYSGADILPYVGYVAPDLRLYQELTAFENLGFFAVLAGLADFDAGALLDRCGLAGRGNDTVSAFSSGMKQRLKLALAILKEPPLLILDEPSANLDSDGRLLVDKIISGHKGICLVATNLEDELKYGDITLRLGR